MELFKRRKAKQKLEIDGSANPKEVARALGVEGKAAQLAVSKFSVECAAWLIAGLISKCEFRTYFKGKPVKGDEYYLWNIKPNPSQNSTLFIQEFVHKLCTETEVLIFSSGTYLYCADSFIKREYALKETEFSNITRKGFTLKRTLKSGDVIYLQLNNESLKVLLKGIQNGFDSMISEATERYLKAGGEKVILNISSMAEQDEKYEEKIQKYLNEYFKKYFESKNAVLPLYEGFEIDSHNKTEKKTTDEFTSISSIKKESMDTAAQAFKIPPAILRGDIADVDTLVDNMLTFSIDPICAQIEEAICCSRYTKDEYLSGTRLSIDTTTIKHIDILSMASNVDKLIACGYYCIDDLKEKVGEAPLGTEFSKAYVRTKNYEVEKQGGEDK